ncbi:hypothetical protein ZTR_05057 [Talaromyces verruculosus]|nr:hypothetical protein ZTR_05057 [Talaromyces verruculosus]
MLSIATVVQLTTFLLVGGPRLCNAVLRQYNFIIHSGTNAPDGVSRPVYLINGQQPGPLIEVDEGDELEVFVTNNLTVENTIHWHGLLQHGTPEMDGVPGVTQVGLHISSSERGDVDMFQYPIPPGGNFTYRFSVGGQYGFYWYHSHFRAYYDDAIRGPLLIHPDPNRSRPFEKLAGNDSAELANIIQAENSATNILLNDWTHETSDTIYGRYIETGAFPFCVDSLIANGQGRVTCLPEYILQAGTGLGLGSDENNSMSMTESTKILTSSSMTMKSMMARDMSMLTSMSSSTTSDTTMASSTAMASVMPSMSNVPLTPRGCTPVMNFRPGFNASSLPPDTCTNTTSPLLAIPANTTQGWLALNLVNSGSISDLSVSLDAHSLWVYAADGLYVTPQEVQLDQMPGNYYLRFASYPTGDMQQVIEGQAIVAYSGQNMKAMATTMAPSINEDPMSTWMLLNGSATANATTLDATSLQPFVSNAPPVGAANVTKRFIINETDIVTWVMDGYPYEEPVMPILYGNTSDGWLANTTIQLPINSTIDIILMIANDSMDTMGHPVHLHGHKFWIVGSGTGNFPYASVRDAPQGVINLHDPMYRDTADIPASGWLAIRFVTDNPGAWLMHCHMQYHLLSGFALVFVEGANELQGVVEATNSTNTPPLPSITTTSTVCAVLMTN